MDRTNDFRDIVDAITTTASSSSSSTLKNVISYTRKSQSPFLMKANEVFVNVEKFETILQNSYESFVGFHHFLSPSSLPTNLCPMEEEERVKLQDEVSIFISASAKTIQNLHHMLDMNDNNNNNNTNSKESDGRRGRLAIEFDQQVLSSLLQKMNRLGVQWDRMQRDRKRYCLSPCRLLCKAYAHLVIPTASLPDEDQGGGKDTMMVRQEGEAAATNNNRDKSVRMEVNNSDKKAVTVPKSSQWQPVDEVFAQRYIDEVAPAHQLRAYQQYAENQKEKLLKEARSLHKRFSEERTESYHMEQTAQSLSSLVVEFSAMVDSQSTVVQDVGDAAKQARENVELTDEELLRTLERSQSQQWGMVILLVTMSLLLLLLHAITP